MKIFKLLAIITIGISFLTCCTQKQEARRPISHASGEFMKESIERNKILNSKEEALIAAIIKKDTAKQYFNSSKGYWYYYNVKDSLESIKPIHGDTIFYDYEIKDLKGNTIYTQEELKSQKYIVDKQQIITGLRDGIKLMRKGEKVTFLFPSHIAYGYHGDNDKIQPNQPIMCIVTLNNIKQNKRKN